MATPRQSSRSADATKSSAVSPHSQITTAPSRERFELLLKRQNGPTCGYISGDTASPMTCRSGFSCTMGIYGEFGCCNAVECDKGYHQACIDAVNQKCLVAGMELGVGCGFFSSVLTCPTACVAHALKSTHFALPSTYTSWSCGPKISTRTALLMATNGGGGDAGDGSGGGSGDNGFDLDTLIPGITGGSGGTGSTGNSNGGGSSSSGGISGAAIGGIVAGGAVVLLMLGLGVVWIRRSRKEKRKPPVDYSQTVVSGWLDNQSQGRY
ncbi:hypothetical protein QBC39DRAFT_337960 [Podospora conica]|nr:hypothetical protein QBC39DRAFT_337960 [Schizothecium conicum]